jgi:hypothetical protein
VAKMPDRITITVPTYMELDGQGQIVLPGSIIDVAAAQSFAAVSTLTTAGGGTLASHGKPTPVSKVRTR